MVGGTPHERPEMVYGTRHRYYLRRKSIGCVFEAEKPLCHSRAERGILLARQTRKSFSEARIGNRLLNSLVIEDLQVKEGANEQMSAEGENGGYQIQTRDGAVSRKRPPSLSMRSDAASEFIEKMVSSTTQNLSEPENYQRPPLPRGAPAISTEYELPQYSLESCTANEYCATATENNKLSQKTEEDAARRMLKDNFLRVSPSGENSHDESTTAIAAFSSPNSMQKTSCVSNECPPTPIPAESDDIHLMHQLTENISLREHLGDALENWAEARKLLCRLRMLRKENPWVVENWDILFKPFIVTANDMYLLVTAFRDSPYCPSESRLPGSEDLERKELDDPEKKYLTKILWGAAKIMKFVSKSCARPDWSLCFRLLNLRQDFPDRRTELERLAGNLRAALGEKGIIIENASGLERISGALRSAVQAPHVYEKHRSSCNPPKQMVFAWINTLGLLFRLDCMSRRSPLLARLKYHKLKHRFQTVPISVSAPSTVVDSSSTDLKDWRVWLKNSKEEKGIMGKIELDDEDRNNITEAILTYQRFWGQISGQSSVDAVLLSHKVTTRIRRYENRLQGKTHMCAVINVHTDYECDSSSQGLDPSRKDQDTNSDETVIV